MGQPTGASPAAYGIAAARISIGVHFAAASGLLRPGDELPTIRALAMRLRVTRSLRHCYRSPRWALRHGPSVASAMRELRAVLTPRRTTFPAGACVVLMLLWASMPCFAQGIRCPVGVNVNSLQNFSAAEQEVIVTQLRQSGVRFVRTSLRPDDKNMKLAKTLESDGIGLVLVTGPLFSPNAPLRPADPKRHMRSAMPLSHADPERSRAYYRTVFDKLDAYGVTLTAVEFGNEVNWPDFNGDFPVPGQGRAFTLEDLSHDPEAKRVARGFLEYLKVLAVLKQVRDHSRLNRHTPIITAGMATGSGGSWQQHLQLDSVSIPTTYAFLRAHGLDDLVDGYGVHTYPPQVKPGDEVAAAQRRAQLDKYVFPPGNPKPYWVTEWGFPSVATSSANDQSRAQSVSEMRDYFSGIFRQGRLGGLFWYVWNEPDRNSIYRSGQIMEAGRRAVAPLPEH